MSENTTPISFDEHSAALEVLGDNINSNNVDTSVKGVSVLLPDNPTDAGKTAAEIKAAFDNLPEATRGGHNGLVANVQNLIERLRSIMDSLTSYFNMAVNNIVSVRAEAEALVAAHKDAESAHTPAQVGLSNVDNTADEDKPVSTAQQEAIDTAVAKEQSARESADATLTDEITQNKDDLTKHENDTSAHEILSTVGAAVSTTKAEILEEIKDIGGNAGEDGGYYIPSVDSDGILTWSPSKAGMEPVRYSNIKGKDGYSPVRGTDYWTASDIAEIKSYVDTAILGGAW